MTVEMLQGAEEGLLRHVLRILLLLHDAARERIDLPLVAARQRFESFQIARLRAPHQLAVCQVFRHRSRQDARSRARQQARRWIVGTERLPLFKARHAL
ncbi:MAG: hypothetical protein L0Z50_15410 [Verrucomicrobiales bacterium]|nr:hypothetical protein [Verrucomicrobiales bacterium]